MMKKKHIKIILSCAMIMIAGLLYSCSFRDKNGQDLITSLENGQKYEDSSDNQSDIDETKDNVDINIDNKVQDVHDVGLIYVHICGAVVNPDVYRIEAGARLIDLIKLAGGLSHDAAGDYINQAMVVEDGQRIYIPTKDEVQSLTLSEYIEGDQGKSGDKEAESKVNINTADETELMNLPGIGQAKAKSIVDYRNKNGKFTDIKDIMKIPGIKEGLFNKICDYITVGN